MFKEIDESNKSEVCLGDEKTLRVEGKGTIAIKTEEEGGYKVVFDEAACAISDKTTRQVLSLIHMDGNMVFPLDVLTVQGKDLVAQIKGDATTSLNNSLGLLTSITEVYKASTVTIVNQLFL